MIFGIFKTLAVAALTLVLAACAGQNILEIDLMPAPEVYEEDGFNPLADASPISELPYNGVLYATDRQPAQEGDKERFFVNDRGAYVHLGVARITASDTDMSWEEARRITLLKNRSTKYPLSVSGIENFGGLYASLSTFAPPEILGDDPHRPAAKYAEAINAQLEVSKRKHVYIYVHGYRVVFENPVLVATELWHFLGYDGVFIAYSWPSTPSKWAYVKDSETAEGYARNLRIFLEYIADHTEAEQIHVLGYSAGTRLVARAFEQMALMNSGATPDDIQARLRIGNLILVGSDIDRGVFGNYLSDGMLDVPSHMTIYMSGTDKALGVSRRLTRRGRLGQMLGEQTEYVEKYLRKNSARLSIIDVTGAEGATSGNGHGYFRNSPWASSDLMYDLRPGERGLIQPEDTAIWTFPSDYIERLRSAIGEVNPDLAVNP